MFYFYAKNLLPEKKINISFIKGLPGFFLPSVGDVLKVFFSKKGSAFFFEGLCFKTKSKHFVLPDSTFSIVNKIKGSSIIFIFSFFYNMVFSIEFSFLKRNNFLLGNQSFFIT